MKNDKKSLLEMDDEELGNAVAGRQHKETISHLKQIASSLKQNSDGGTKLEKLVQGHTEVLNNIGEKMEKLSSIELKSPDVIVNTNQEPIIKEIKDLCEDIKGLKEDNATIISLLQKKPSRIKIQRNGYGTLDYVDIEYK